MTAPYGLIGFSAAKMLRQAVEILDNPGLNMYTVMSADRYENAVTGNSIAFVLTGFKKADPELQQSSAAFGNQIVNIQIRVRHQLEGEVVDEAQIMACDEAHARTVGRIIDILNRSTIIADLAAVGYPGIGCDALEWDDGRVQETGSGIKTTIDVAMRVYATE